MALALVVAAVVLVATPGSGDGGWRAEGTERVVDLVADDVTVCSADEGGRLSCREAATGEERFSERVGDGLRASTVVDHTVLVGQVSGAQMMLTAYALDGTQRWGRELGTAVVTQAAAGTRAVVPVAGGTAASVVGGRSDGEMVGLDLASGEERCGHP